MIRKIIVVILTLGAGYFAYYWIAFVTFRPMYPMTDIAYMNLTGVPNVMFRNDLLPTVYLAQRKIILPFWIIFFVLLAYPTIAFIRGPLRRYRRRKRGLCVTCGYDLTGNESRVCSECGHGV